jgi:hypothetical protein
MAESKKAERPAMSPAEQAIVYEASIAEEAARIKGDAGYLNAELLAKLFPLLMKAIPSAYIEHVGAVKGKPYESTGVRSVQVQIDRLNNVLGPGNWRDNYTYEDEGRICHVAITVLGDFLENGEREILVTRSSYGGVDHASTRGNFYKGSYTNAAKVAIARLGPGHEIYVGVPDLDPDVSAEMAKDASGAAEKEEPKAKKIGAEEIEQLKKLWKQSGVDEKAWRTFLSSRRKRDVKNFDTDDMQAAIAFLSEQGNDEEEKS